MQIIDKKYRLFGVINVIDLLVVVALLVGGLVVYRLLWGGQLGGGSRCESEDVEYTILCSPLRNYKEGQIKVGDPGVDQGHRASPSARCVSVSTKPTPGDVWSAS